MPQSNDIAALAEALAAAQGEMTHASKDAENPAFKRGDKASKYADLSDVIDAIRQPFAKNGLSYVQLLKSSETSVVVETMLMHKSGQWISSEMSIPVTAKTPHGYGSTLTYVRRYSLAAISGVTQADDDGNAGTPKGKGQVEVSEAVYLEHAHALESAKDVNALRVAFAKAQRVCQKDQNVLAKLIFLKDTRKQQLDQEAA